MERRLHAVKGPRNIRSQLYPGLYPGLSCQKIIRSVCLSTVTAQMMICSGLLLKRNREHRKQNLVVSGSLFAAGCGLHRVFDRMPAGVRAPPAAGVPHEAAQRSASRPGSQVQEALGGGD